MSFGFLSFAGCFLFLTISSTAQRSYSEQLCNQINDYRQENGLSRIPFSTVMFEVAEGHAENFKYYKDQGGSPGLEGSCNLHTWYEQPGQWFTDCCYTSDHAAAQCLWDKPREFTTTYSGCISYFSYPGYENSAWGYGSTSQALDGWKTSPGHNGVILNLNGWSSKTWRSLGCGVDMDIKYYFAWFSDLADPNGYDASFSKCGAAPPTPEPTPRPVSTSCDGITCSRSDKCFVTITVRYTLSSGDTSGAYNAVKTTTDVIANQAWTTGSISRRYGWSSSYTQYTVGLSEETDICTFYTLAVGATYQNDIRTNLAPYVSGNPSIDVGGIVSGGSNAAQESDGDGSGGGGSNNNKKTKWWEWFLVILAALFVGSAVTFGVMVWRNKKGEQKWQTNGGAKYQQMADFN